MREFKVVVLGSGGVGECLVLLKLPSSISNGERSELCREVSLNSTVRVGMFHREIRPDDRGLLPKRDWGEWRIWISVMTTLNRRRFAGGQLAVRSGDTGHSWHWTVRLHARPLHQKRPRIHRHVLAHKPPDLPGHHHDAERHQPGEGQPTSSNTPSRKQAWFRLPKRGFHWRRWVLKKSCFIWKTHSSELPGSKSRFDL